LDREFDDIGLEPGTVDAAITALNFHDIYNDDPAAAAVLLASVRICLKRGAYTRWSTTDLRYSTHLDLLIHSAEGILPDNKSPNFR
jgi:hypothetical protein